MKEEKKVKIMEVIIVVAFLIFFAYIMITTSDEGEYDYCVEWQSIDKDWIDSVTLHRDRLIYNCYDLVSQTFYCDYEIQDNGNLMVKPILNITKDRDGMITEIRYDEPNYFECTRWLKSGR